MNNLCPKCGHHIDLHCRQVEALLQNIEKHNEVVAAIECEAKVDGSTCGCLYRHGV